MMVASAKYQTVTIVTKPYEQHTLQPPRIYTYGFVDSTRSQVCVCKARVKTLACEINGNHFEHFNEGACRPFEKNEEGRLP